MTLKSLTRRAGAPLLCLGVGAALVAWLSGHGGDAAATLPATTPGESALLLGPADVTTVQLRPWLAAQPVSGALAARQRTTLRAKVPAEVRRTLAAEGAVVRAGQVLAQLDDADLRAQLAKQQALRKEALARLALAQSQYQSSTRLLEQQFIARHAFDTAASNLELARAALDAADAQLEIARRAVADAVIRAPYAGIISKRFVQQGDKVAPDTPLFAVLDVGQLVLEAAVPSGDIARIRLGQPATFRVDAYPERDFSGVVARINPEAEAGSRAMTVYIDVDNRERALSAGMFAKGSIALPPSAPRLLVPSAAVHRKDGATLVYRIDNGRLEAQAVQAGKIDDAAGVTEIVSGLAPGTRIAGVRLDGARAGRAVRLPADGGKEGT